MSGGQRNVVLTGFMGTGKSTVGRALADRLGMAWVDTDRLIEARHGPIPAIFAKQGEEAFRALERRVAEELGSGRGLVISTGGKTMLDPVAAEALQHNASVFCLVASPPEILSRIEGQGIDRPLLADDPAATIERLLDARRAGYRQFPQIATDNRQPDEIASEIAAMLADA